MSNIEHSTIVDPYIHEPKGVAAATAGQVYVANGSSSGAWTTPSSVPTYSIFSITTAPLIGGSYAPVDLDTTVHADFGSIVSGLAQIPAGTYRALITLSVPSATTAGLAQAKLFNGTLGSDISPGFVGKTSTSGSVTLVFPYYFTVSGTTGVGIRAQCTSGGGSYPSASSPLYGTLELWKF